MAIDLILEGAVDGKQEEEIKTIIPCTSLNLVSLLICCVTVVGWLVGL